MENSRPSKWPSWHYALLWIIVLISLTFNVLLLAGLINFRSRARQQVANASELLDTVTLEESLEVPITVDESLPISITVPFSDTFRVDINETVPISSTILVEENIEVPINDVVRINRDLTVSVVLAGIPIPVDIPIRADIPISLNLDVPVNLEVPVDMEIPIDLAIAIPIRTEVPIDTTVPVQLDFPVTVPLDQLGFNALLEQVQEALKLLAEALGAPLESAAGS
jgi:hypothetical protein